MPKISDETVQAVIASQREARAKRAIALLTQASASKSKGK